MKLLLDTNILVAAPTRDTERSADAIQPLHQAGNTCVSVTGLMELRSALTKKMLFERDRIDQIERHIVARTTVRIPDAPDVMTATPIRSKTLLYPMDGMILATVEAIDAPLLPFDTGLLGHGAEHPQTVLQLVSKGQSDVGPRNPAK